MESHAEVLPLLAKKKASVDELHVQRPNMDDRTQPGEVAVMDLCKLLSALTENLPIRIMLLCLRCNLPKRIQPVKNLCGSPPQTMAPAATIHAMRDPRSQNPGSATSAVMATQAVKGVSLTRGSVVTDMNVNGKVAGEVSIYGATYLQLNLLPWVTIGVPGRCPTSDAASLWPKPDTTAPPPPIGLPPSCSRSRSNHARPSR